MKKHLTLLGVAAVATAVLAGCSNDELVKSYQGEEISFRTRVETRATGLDLEKLGNFSVYAKGVHHSGDLYTQFLIGSDATNGAEIAMRDGESTIWKLGRSVFWPSGMDRVFFWAYTTQSKSEAGAESTKNNTLCSGSVSFGSNGPKIAGFTPAKADVTKSSDTDNWKDGENQKDLLIAFANQEKTGGTSVNLEFKHALSQINITAMQNGKTATDHRIVKIKGAWIVNVKDKGDLTAGFTWDKAEEKAVEEPVWDVSASSVGVYGSYSKEAFDLKTGKKEILGNNGSLMIIPQNVSGWNAKSASTAGAYILLLCRVELEHDGSTHIGEDIGDVEIVGNKHYHQLFPVADTYNKDKYGFSCVPLEIDWKMGTKYVYNLDICGATSGAGLYPPTITDDMLNKLVPSSEQSNIIRDVPSGKNVGDPVLDEAIKFNVTVSGWTNVAGEEDESEEKEVDMN